MRSVAAMEGTVRSLVLVQGGRQAVYLALGVRPDGTKEALGLWIEQTCIVHLLRHALSFAAWKDRRELAAALRPIYTAVNAEAAREALEDFAAGSHDLRTLASLPPRTLARRTVLVRPACHALIGRLKWPSSPYTFMTRVPRRLVRLTRGAILLVIRPNSPRPVEQCWRPHRHGCVHEFWPTCADEYWPTLRGLICYAGPDRA
jgi:Transposase, Mutator family